MLRPYVHLRADLTGRAKVPGGIYSDLRAAGILPEDPLHSQNDVKYRWVSKEDWIFERTFEGIIIIFGCVKSCVFFCSDRKHLQQGYKTGTTRSGHSVINFRQRTASWSHGQYVRPV